MGGRCEEAIGRWVASERPIDIKCQRHASTILPLRPDAGSAGRAVACCRAAANPLSSAAGNTGRIPWLHSRRLCGHRLLRRDPQRGTASYRPNGHDARTPLPRGCTHASTTLCAAETHIYWKLQRLEKSGLIQQGRRSDSSVMIDTGRPRHARAAREAGERGGFSATSRSW